VPGDRVLLGQVLGAHGLKGEVKVRTFTAEPRSLGAYGPVAMEDGRVFRIVSLRTAKGEEAIVTLAGIEDRTSAESLKGARLYVPRAVLPAPEADEFYLADLVGLAVEDETGAVRGRVRSVQNFGAGDVLEIENANGEAAFVPFTKDAVPAIDLTGRRITVRSAKDEQEEESKSSPKDGGAAGTAGTAGTAGAAGATPGAKSG